ncbi:uncharacterized protein LOC111241601 [Vigna radiata var. radiata]|uniref:Uncharacterized protein LOC111241601 n=1 Tax=Vigna radiata var. radiata TaxID=3916 RepID=A0A3Q0F064_VIGRR|nr:uncharacterized protein LOC111241601 [Vigna radiata var. radiata]
MRNVSKKKFLTCFRPVHDTDAMLQPRAVVDRSSSRRFACIPVADEHNAGSSATKSTFSEQELPQKVVPHPPKPTFSKEIKAMLIETVLNTKARKKNLDSQTCFGSKRGFSVYTESSSTGDVKQVFVDSKIEKIKPSEWSSTISSSNSAVSESKNISEIESSNEKVENEKKFECVGIFWVFVSLVVTVFWGKVNVIIWTSLLLCFFSLWNASCCWQKEVPKLGSVESKAYKNSRRERSGRSGRNKEH